ncbi:MAG: nickel pincer cofactor biosynthesis protein LarB [Verrucomicrobia bacterium]|nr:nickel pincer cofactor biosynthesis protein LarB [Verrucomicrobiota bacterium]
MSPTQAAQLLDAFQQGTVSRDAVLRAFQSAPVADLGFAAVDLHRELRKGCPEVIFGAGKTPSQVAAIAAELVAASGRVLVTRATDRHAAAVRRRIRRARYHAEARCIVVDPKSPPAPLGEVAVVSAGTSDLPVAEEAALTAEFMGSRVRRITDVGVAGLHRLFRRLDELQRASVVVVVAGMEAALPSVIGGLVDKPLIGVPTSVGYGSHFGGITALLGMLNSCASGLTVVNIDNGFGAGYAAARINALAATAAR